MRRPRGSHLAKLHQKRFIFNHTFGRGAQISGRLQGAEPEVRHVRGIRHRIVSGLATPAMRSLSTSPERTGTCRTNLPRLLNPFRPNWKSPFAAVWTRQSPTAWCSVSAPKAVTHPERGKLTARWLTEKRFR